MPVQFPPMLTPAARAAHNDSGVEFSQLRLDWTNFTNVREQLEAAGLMTNNIHRLLACLPRVNIANHSSSRFDRTLRDVTGGLVDGHIDSSMEICSGCNRGCMIWGPTAIMRSHKRRCCYVDNSIPLRDLPVIVDLDSANDVARWLFLNTLLVDQYQATSFFFNEETAFGGLPEDDYLVPVGFSSVLYPEEENAENVQHIGHVRFLRGRDGAIVLSQAAYLEVNNHHQPREAFIIQLANGLWARQQAIDALDMFPVP